MGLQGQIYAQSVANTILEFIEKLEVDPSNQEAMRVIDEITQEVDRIRRDAEAGWY